MLRSIGVEDMNQINYSKYPAYFECNPDNTYTVRLRNWDGAFSQAETLEQAQAQARVLLIDVLNSLIADNEIVPNAVEAQEGDYLIELPIDTQLKIALLNNLIESRCRKVDLAKGLNIPPQRLTSFLSLKKTTNLNFLSKAFSFLGKNLTFSF